MPPRSSAPFVALALLAGAAGWASPAACQTQTAAVWEMPDFDQRRANLPNDGGAHCVPTASINMMAFIANHGFAGMMNGPRNWQSQANHDFVSGNILIMGALMGTTGTGGTGGSGWENGLQEWLNDHAPGVFTVTRLSVSSGVHSVTPLTMYNALHSGSLASFAYGRYTRSAASTYDRTGGHAVSLGVVTLSLTPGVLSSVQYRDPATADGNLNAQSTFSYRIGLVRRDTIPLSNGTSRTMWELLLDPPPPSGTRRFIDTIVVVDPAFVFTPNQQAILVARPWRFSGSLTPPLRTIPAPAGSSIQRAEIAPDLASALVVTNTGPAAGPRLWHLTLETGVYDELMPLPSADTPVAISRHTGEYYFPNVDNVLFRYSTVQAASGDLSLAQQQSHRPASPIGAAAYDDDADEVLVLLPAVRQMLFYPRTLGTPIIRPLIGTFTLTGAMSIQPGPAGTPVADKYFVRAGSSILQFRQVVDGLQMETSVTPGGGAITGFTMTDMGTMLIARAGQIVEYWRDPTSGAWVPLPGSMFTGLAAGAGIAVSRSRSNYDPTLHNIPGWEQIIDDVAGTDLPDCAPDFNHDHTLNSQDFFAFLAAFFAVDISADVNFDGAINSQDFFAYLVAFFAGC